MLVFSIWIPVLPLLFVPFLLISVMASSALADIRSDVRALFDRDMTNVDFAEVKVIADSLTNPSIDVEATLAEIDRMAAHIKTAIPPNADDWDKIGAIQQYVYEPGYWNDGREFGYDHTDPTGQSQHGRILANFLKSRRGNCISMPLLIIGIGQRLGLDFRPGTAPLHMFVRYIDDKGQSHNLEATSGAGRARDNYYREISPITDEAIANRVYLATLTNEEAIAVIAMAVVNGLIFQERHFDAMAVADIILEHYPTYAYAMLRKGSAAYLLLKTNFYDVYPDPNDVPRDQHDYVRYLQRINKHTFDTAEALGWREWKPIGYKPTN